MADSNYGLITDSVTSSFDWGAITSGVTTSLDYQLLFSRDGYIGVGTAAAASVAGSKGAVLGTAAPGSAGQAAASGPTALSGTAASRSSSAAAVSGAGSVVGAGSSRASAAAAVSATGSASGACASRASTAALVSAAGNVSGGAETSTSASAQPTGQGVVLAFAATRAAAAALVLGLGAALAGCSGGSVATAIATGIATVSGTTASRSSTSATYAQVLFGTAAGGSSASALVTATGLVSCTTSTSTSCRLISAVLPGFWEALGNTVRARFDAQVLVPTHFDSMPFTKPADGKWIRLRFGGGEMDQTTLGKGDGFRARGQAVAEIHVPINAGKHAALAIADTVKLAFRQITLEPVTFETPYMQDRGRASDGVSWQVDVVLPFRKDRTAPIAQGSGGLLGFDGIEDVVNDRFDVRVAQVYAVPTQFDNMPEETFADELHVRWSVLIGQSVLVDRGGSASRYRTPGVAIAAIRIPIEQGDQAALELADRIDPVFRAVTDRGVVFKTPSVRPVGREGPWWRVNVTCPFYAEEIS